MRNRIESLLIFLKWPVEDFVHQRRIDRVDGSWLIEWLRGFAAFHIADRLPNAGAKIVIHDRARIFAEPGGSVGAPLKMLARKWRDDQPARPFERRRSFTQRHATYDSSEFHAKTKPRSEARSAKEIRRPNAERRRALRTSASEFAACFGFRISVFGFFIR